MNRALPLLLVAVFSVHAVEPKTYDVRGVVKEVRREKAQLVVRHDEIPGYMEAMVMAFTVRDRRLLDAVKPGDVVSFRLSVTDQDDWIDTLNVTGHATLPALAPDAAAVEPLKPGDPLPDFTLTDSRGQPVRLADYRGCAFAYTFIFTRCPFPKFCPLLTEKFAKTQALLAGGAAKLLSISIDPAHDTPEVLATYAARYQADPVRWRIATGDLAVLTTLALRSGANFWEEKGVLTHNLRTVVIGSDGKVRRIFTDNEWTPAQLAEELTKAVEK
jgi:protein SCO1/2